MPRAYGALRNDARWPTPRKTRMNPTLRCELQQLPDLARRYHLRYAGEDNELDALKEPVASRGFLTGDDLRAVANGNGQD